MMRQEQLAETARRIRLVAVDLDGTGLTDEKEFTPYTRRTLQALIDRGYQVVPTTGRSYYGLVENLLKLDGVKYAITADGAFVTEHETGTRNWEETIRCERAASLGDELLEDGNCVYYHRNDARCTHVMACTDRELYENHIWRPGFPDPKGLVTEHFGDCIRELNEDVVKIGLFFDLEAYSFERYEGLMQEKYPEISYFRADRNSLEITSCETSKGKALAFLAGRLGLDPSEICAFGDNGNDVEMLRYAGLGVAMGNAIPAAQEAADHIIGTNNEESVAKFIEAYFLK